MTNDTNTSPTPETSRYSYDRSTDGVDDTFMVENKDGTIVLGLYFWGEPDTDVEAKAEAKIAKLVEALNMPGGWIDLGQAITPYLAQHNAIAVYWSFHDVFRIRPDLSQEQAWAVLQQADRDVPRYKHLTVNRLRRTAAAMFPRKAKRRTKKAAA